MFVALDLGSRLVVHWASTSKPCSSLPLVQFVYASGLVCLTLFNLEFNDVDFMAMRKNGKQG